MSEAVKKELPEKWDWVTFGDVADLLRGVSYKKGDASSKPVAGKVPVLRANNIGNGLNFDSLVYVPEKQVKEEQYIRKGDIIIAMSSGSKHLVGKAAQANDDFKGAYGAFCANLRVTADVDPKYVAYYYSSQDNLKRISGSSKGSNINNLKREHVLGAPIPIAPSEQQKRIVAKIEELFSHIDTGIEALKKAKQLLKQYRQSVLKAAVTGELTKEWREANKAIHEPAAQLLEHIEIARNVWIEEQIKKDDSEAKRLKNKLKKHEFEELNSSLVPDGWESVSLTKLCLLVVDCHNKTAPYVKSGIPLIRTSNIRDGVINFDEKMKYVNQETYEYWSRRCPPEPGDILFTREAPMGESAIIPDGKKVCMGQRMMLLRVMHDLIDVEYLHIALMDPLFQKRVQGFKVGVGVQHLRVGDVEKAVVALPSLTEQKEIVRIASDRLDSITRLENEIDQKLVMTDRNKQSILTSAFTGSLNGI